VPAPAPAPEPELAPAPEPAPEFAPAPEPAPEFAPAPAPEPAPAPLELEAQPTVSTMAATAAICQPGSGELDGFACLPASLVWRMVSGALWIHRA
jgi:hypothetical protein